MWIFDQSDGSARLLRSRCGHSAPPTMIRFPTIGGHTLISAGNELYPSVRSCDLLLGGNDRSLRLFSVVKDSTSCELSQGTFTLS